MLTEQIKSHKSHDWLSQLKTHSEKQEDREGVG